MLRERMLVDGTNVSIFNRFHFANFGRSGQSAERECSTARRQLSETMQVREGFAAINAFGIRAWIACYGFGERIAKRRSTDSWKFGS